MEKYKRDIIEIAILATATLILGLILKGL